MIETPERNSTYYSTGRELHRIASALHGVQRMLEGKQQEEQKIETPEKYDRPMPRIYDTGYELHRIACTLRGIERLLELMIDENEQAAGGFSEGDSLERRKEE